MRLAMLLTVSVMLAACSSDPGIVGNWARHRAPRDSTDNEIFDTIRVRSDGRGQRTTDRQGRSLPGGHDRVGGGLFLWRTEGDGEDARFCVKDTPTAREQCLPYELSDTALIVAADTFHRAH